MDQDSDGFKITFRLASKMPADLWKIASSYMRGYARQSHWTLGKVSQQLGHVAFHIKHAPPKPPGSGRAGPHRSQHPASRKNPE